jgi:uncharacterized DUF497 family protein
MKFEWDPVKNNLNKKKHRVDFREAKTVFYDPYMVRIDDEENSTDIEDRFLVIGLNRKEMELTVCHCYRDDGKTIRIFSARHATNAEKEIYREAKETAL